MSSKTKKSEIDEMANPYQPWINDVLNKIDQIHNELIRLFENRVSAETTDDYLVTDMLNTISDIFKEHNSKWDFSQDDDLALPYSVEYTDEWDKEGNISKYSEYLVPILHQQIEFVLSIPVRCVTMTVVSNRDIGVKNTLTMFNIGYPAIKPIDNTAWGNI